ncbi:unannotated protein [freshwater metagenome]|uniref:Unannotated protein n=1 Tax=freshwater metagenome TaxID=449393 RepID=A0A6J7U4Q0_9ZZZZ
MKLITDAPVASPSKPSVKFTPLLVATIIKNTQIMTATAPNLSEVSRTVDKCSETGVNPVSSGKFKPAQANAIANTLWPNIFDLARNPKER